MMISRAETTQALPLLFVLASGAGGCGQAQRDVESDVSSAGTPGGGAGASGTLTGGGAGTGGSAVCDAEVAANAVNNYSFSSTLSFPPVAVKPGTDLSFDWRGVTRDIVGREVDPLVDVDQVTILTWRLSLEEFEKKLNGDDFAARDPATVPLTLFTDNDVTSGNLLSFTLAGSPVLAEEVMPFFDATEYPPEEHTYTVLVATGKPLLQGTRMIQSFRLDPASDNTDVIVTSASTTLDYTVDLDGLMPTRIPAATAAIRVDWSELDVNGLGDPFQATNINRVLLGRYTETVAELEANFLDLESMAEDLFQADVPTGTDFDLSALTTATGQAFSGIDENSTWLLALICGDCMNPAPWYLTVLEPCN